MLALRSRSSSSAPLDRLRPGGGDVDRLALGAVAIGATAVGSFAIGALAVGALAIGRLRVRQASFGQVSIDRLDVGELRVGGEPLRAPAPPTPPLSPKPSTVRRPG